MRVLFFFISVVAYNIWVLFNLFLALKREENAEKPLISINRIKFYYDWRFFMPKDFDVNSLRGLHRRWIEKSLIPERIVTFIRNYERYGA